jgi:hypothetical protein
MLIPSDLNPGDQFRVIFVSSTKRDAQSANIADYDQFITNLAVAAGIDTYFGSPVMWQALGSTSTVNAVDRLPLTLDSPPLYRIDGAVVSLAVPNLWTFTNIANPINQTESGDVVSGPVWTGTGYGGTGNYYPLGDPYPRSLTEYGFADMYQIGWLSYDVAINFNSPHDIIANMRLYGYSSVLTIPSAAAVPEPTTMLLLGLGLIGLAGIRRKCKM